MKVLFWGTPEFALPAYRALGEEGHFVVGAVTQPDRPAGRGRGVSMSPIKRAALEDGVPVLQPERARGDEFLEQLRALEPDISVVVAYGQILRPEVLTLPPLGSVNIHASLLPALRGAAPIQWAILRGYQTTGVTIMQMEAGLDSGPILLQVEEPIRDDETGTELTQRLSETGAEALIDTLALMESQGVVSQPQDHAQATYAPKLDRGVARIDWARPAHEVARHIRGLDAVPGAWSPLDDGAPVKLFRAAAVPSIGGAPGVVLQSDPAEGVIVAAGDGAVNVREVQPPGKRRMTAAEWVRGRGVVAGARFG
jgi:methionyl-tRNA formyltransferase